MISVSYRKARVTTEIFRFGETDKIHCNLLLEPINYIGKIFHMTFLGEIFWTSKEFCSHMRIQPFEWLTHRIHTYMLIHRSFRTSAPSRPCPTLCLVIWMNEDPCSQMITWMMERVLFNDYSCSSYIAVTEAQSEAAFSTTRTTISTRFKFQGCIFSI